MAARKIDGWWYADFRVRKVRYRKRSPKNTRVAALEYEELLRGELAANTSLKHLEPAPELAKVVAPTFSAFVERLITNYLGVNYRYSEQRQREYVIRSCLVPFFGPHRLDEVTGMLVEDYKGALLRQGRSKKTVNNHLTILRMCLTVAKDWELIDTVPRFKILRVCEPPPFTYLLPEESSRLVCSLPDGLWRTMIIVALRTGLRYSELIALRWSDINFQTRLICVQRAEVRTHVGPTKNGRVRHVPMTKEVMNALTSLGPGDGRVFSFRGRSVPYQRAWTRLNDACQRATTRCVSWHDLRHTFASDLTQRGVSLHAIKDLLGHKSIEMTLRYAHLGTKSLHQAVATLETEGDSWAAGGQENPTGPPSPRVEPADGGAESAPT